jgi:prepilin-type N-terminal cleavage/methylation domain-containing protein
MRRRFISFRRGPSKADGGDGRGLTLVELLIVLAIMSLVAGAIMSVFMTSLRAYWKGSLTTQVQKGGRVAFDRLSRDLRAARRLCGSPACGTHPVGGVNFDTVSCTQIGFVQAHLGPVTLNDGKTVIYATDPNGGGVIPYDGYYVSYYLAATPGSTTVSPTGPYLERALWDLNANAISITTVAGPERQGATTFGGANISNLAFAVGGGVGGCPVAATRDILVTVTASQNATGQSLQDTAVFTGDISLRNQ